MPRSDGERAVPRDALTAVATTTMITLAILGLHTEVVAGAAAWLAAWLLLRDPAAGRR